jgi:hypothetical protein
MEEYVVQRGRDIGLRTTSWLSSCIHSDEGASMQKAGCRIEKTKEIEGSLMPFNLSLPIPNKVARRAVKIGETPP